MAELKSKWQTLVDWSFKNATVHSTYSIFCKVIINLLVYELLKGEYSLSSKFSMKVNAASLLFLIVDHTEIT